jgi:signal transduction histidine kinase
MTAVDELRKALPYAEAWGAASRSLAFRRIAELLIRARGTADMDLRVHALATLERLRPLVSPAARRDVARLAAEHWPDRTMLWLLRHEPPEVIAGLAAQVELPDTEWQALAAELPAPTRALVARVQSAIAAPVHPAVEDGAERLDELRERLRPAEVPPVAALPAGAQLAALAGDWRWECDARGRLTFIDGGGPGTRITSLFEFDGADAIWPAFVRQAPFRDVEVSGADVGWRLAGVPFFDRGSGRFLGYRGTAARVAPAGLFGTAASADALAKVAHEVRSPLNAIMGFAQMIESETLGAAPEPYRRRAGAILDNAHRLLGALDDLTDAARLDRGHWPVAPEPVDAALLVERIAERHRALGAARAVGVAATSAPGVPPALADPRSLDRALKRLLAAVLAVAESGETLLLGAQRAGADVRLFLTRPGSLDDLSSEQLYETADAARDGATAPLLGLGFGLRLVRQLAEAMGGSFAIEPHRFTLTLPAARNDEQPVAKSR